MNVHVLIHQNLNVPSTIYETKCFARFVLAVLSEIVTINSFNYKSSSSLQKWAYRRRSYLLSSVVFCESRSVSRILFHQAQMKATKRLSVLAG